MLSSSQDCRNCNITGPEQRPGTLPCDITLKTIPTCSSTMNSQWGAAAVVCGYFIRPCLVLEARELEEMHTDGYPAMQGLQHPDRAGWMSPLGRTIGRNVLSSLRRTNLLLLNLCQNCPTTSGGSLKPADTGTLAVIHHQDQLSHMQAWDC